MQWRGRRQSSNIEDRRGGGGLGGGFNIPIGRGGGGMRRAGAGGGIGFIIIALILFFVFGINPLTLIEGGGVSTGPGPGFEQSRPGGAPGGVQATADETDDFVATVLAETENVWSQIFQQNGQDYPEPTLVLFDGSVRSACGFASAASGPFYCPGDSKLYIDLAFFRQLKRQLQSPGDFAQAYVIAHEVGHHVQNVIGVLPRFNEERQRLDQARANALSVRVELQADCFAGIWANRTGREGILDAGDIDEALNAATQIGDDTLQKRSQGYVVPESFNHGTSEQRRRWFERGYREGDMAACDTFSAREV